MDSLWTKTVRLPRFAPLKKDIHTDVLIVGGGMAGLLCAYFLQQAGVDYALVEAGRICGGVTKNTTAKITAQHGLLYDKLIREFGEEKAKGYLAVNQRAVERYRALAREIDCGFEEKDNWVYSMDDSSKIQREQAALQRLGFDAMAASELALPITVARALCFPRQAQFHPLEFAAAIARDLRIYEHTKVRQLAPHKAVTDGGTIHAKRMVIATHFPILNKHGGYFLKMYQHRSYVLALQGAQVPDGMYVDEAQSGLSFRGYGDILLLGGGSHRTGKQGGAWQELEAFARAHYPDAKEVYRWAAQDCMTLDGIPYIGQYSSRTEGLYVATGFNKWGMSSSMVAAELLRDLLTGKENACADLFSPSRTMLRPQLALNTLESVRGFLRPTAPRCPHLGCALKYNREEHSWDCPCHGSRFGEDGTLLDGPATDDKQLRKA
ncbi:MAG: FAD-dependent oxidoreductase [Oscillospiraceae bacterium]|nr:FAD-dependent oxidoreductase [Oscillospiraceae bacterium]